MQVRQGPAEHDMTHVRVREGPCIYALYAGLGAFDSESGVLFGGDDEEGKKAPRCV